MLNISEELKNIYKNDSLPYVDTLSYKELILTFTDGSNILVVSKDQIVGDSFSLTESLCSEIDLTFGGCEASQCKITVADVETELKGMTLTVVQRVNNTHEIPLGVFVVESAKKQANLRFKDVVAYDYCKLLDVDVADWYNALTWPMTLKAFRLSLFNHLGIECEEQTLVNDSVMLAKTINPETLLARDVAKQIAEINGAFGHMSREGRFKYIVLSLSYGLYPSVRLFPNPLLFPVNPNDASYNAGTEDENIVKAMYNTVEYEEYKCEEITKLQIRQESGDIGVIVGDGANAYVIEGNFLVYGKSSSELNEIAMRAFGNMKKRPYRPFRGENIGLPYVEVGDSVSYVGNDQVVSYIMTRTLTGIHALTDTYEATGNKEISQVESVRTQIQRLKGKTNVLNRTVDELSNTITNVEEGLETKILQTDNKIDLEVKRAIGQEVELAAAINVLEGQVLLKVSQGDMESYVRVQLDNIEITSDQISLNGYTSINGNFIVDNNGNLVLVGPNFKVYITSTGLTFFDKNDNRPANYTNVGFNSISTGDITCNMLNGGTPATMTNVNSAISTAISNLVLGTGYSIYATRDTTSSTGSYDAIRFLDAHNADRAATLSFVMSKIGSASDERIKENIQPLENMLNLFMQIEPVSFKYKDRTTGKIGTCFGVKAQQVKELFPLYKYDVVTKNNSDINETVRELCPDGMYEVNYNNLHMLTMRVVQEQQKVIEDLQKRVTELEKSVGGGK